MRIANFLNKIVNFFSDSGKNHKSNNNVLKKTFKINSEVSSTNINYSKKLFKIIDEKRIEIPSKFKVTAQSRSQVCPRCRTRKSAKRGSNGRLVCKICDYDMDK
jgi:formylmethanofuran dehydrogenase subunit E